jgi:S-formylglutathione hydrolase FrmB
MRIIFFIVCIAVCTSALANVDTVSMYSNALQKTSKAVVITPKNYRKKSTPYPVVYILHGYSDNYATWLKKIPELEQHSTLFNTIIVCPDGGFSSWYVNSPFDSSYQYETYLTKELVPFIDQQYNSIKNRTGRAITGHSMGGHGGMYIGWRNSHLFGACGSMSGGVDLHYSKKKFDVAKRIGSFDNYPNHYKQYSVLYVVENKPTDSLAIIIDCGVNDFFFNDNKALHAKLLQLQINHDYIERPGKHEWLYWKNAIQYQLLYFSNYFKNKQL